jgi:sugar phosphate isomerase/epimerase
LDREEREKAISCAESTIELASRIGVRAVIVHRGFVPSDLQIDFEERPHQLAAVGLDFLKDKLYRLYSHAAVKSKEYAEVKETLEKERIRMGKPYFEAAKISLDRLASLALKREVKLGIETRDSFNEIPQFDEMENILEEFEGSPIGYWHDVGHAEKSSRLGFTPNGEWLSRFKEKMIGVHLHDVRRLQDHYLPGIGDMDWDFVAECLPQGIITVCEVGEWNNRQKIGEVVPFLRKKGILR